MKSIVEENLISFKTLEEKIFSFVCVLAQTITRIILESYDAELAVHRDRKKSKLYRDNAANETPSYALVGKRRGQHGKSAVPEGKSRAVGNN